jgi:hypothetical protein
MLSILQVLTVVLVALAMALALAHAFELPGKMRLAKDQYFAVQRIYYPGFTIAGISEPAGFISTIVLLFLTPRGTLAFWLTLIALIGLIGMQVVYWILIHPVNKVWLQGETLGGFGSGFLGSDGRGFKPEPTPPSGRPCVTGGNMRTWVERDSPR